MSIFCLGLGGNISLLDAIKCHFETSIRLILVEFWPIGPPHWSPGCRLGHRRWRSACDSRALTQESVITSPRKSFGASLFAATPSQNSPRVWRAVAQSLAGRIALAVSVSDEGVARPAQLAHRIYDAFVIAKPHRSGAGLRISRSILESHNRLSRAADNAPRGAGFYLNQPGSVEERG